ncbi:hypothetical protein EEB18_010075 [Sphingopyxis sp. OPL5]|uniref:hypothetical protein n=1 Tax=Sphingopyxis sp. OPL5 TaxID=2486273 RepID=UPI00164CE506|nr:hypothetical protein [Sphingopyxis sp. OPL5]QNO29241.1 hypothetical protein EEB18_010075 [Sphingopyxis sp. OPL5]
MRIASFHFLFAALLLAAATPRADAATADDGVLVIGALHDLHDSEPAFGYDQLRAAILAFAPDVLVIEVRPDELAERKATPGRPEYPAVVWPLLAHMEVESIAMEPGGEMFETIAGEAGAAFAALKQRDPDGAAALSRLDSDIEQILLRYWQNAGQVQDATTASLAGSVQAAQFVLVGPAFVAAQSRWDKHMADQTRQAVRNNPGKKMMVIGSYRNRAMLETAVREIAPRRVLDASDWIGRLNPAKTVGDQIGK